MATQGHHLDRLTAVDASFLTNETSNSHMHVGAILIFEGPPPKYVDLVEHVRGRLSQVPRFRQRLVVPPLEAGRPLWADDVNFNSGVLLLNLPAWREEDIAGAAVAYLTDGRHQFLVDQEAINAVLPGRIGEVDPRWNVQTEHFAPPHQATLPLDEAQLAELIKDPWIVHYTTAVKAWSYECTHPFRDEWFASLDQTPYRGWRPSRAAYVADEARGIAKRVKKRVTG